MSKIVTGFSVTFVNELSLRILFNTPASTDEYRSRVSLLAYCRHSLLEEFTHQISDVICSYNTLLINTVHIASPPQLLISQLERALARYLHQYSHQAHETLPTKHVMVPVYYSEETGPDLARLAHAKNMSQQQLIEIHSATSYTVCALGFAPGFAYLGFVDNAIAAPRLTTPRKQVNKGAVGIADNQTGIYPASSPGGWNIIGQTPTDMLQREHGTEQVCPVEVGDTLSFTPIQREQFIALGGILA